MEDVLCKNKNAKSFRILEKLIKIILWAVLGYILLTVSCYYILDIYNRPPDTPIKLESFKLSSKRIMLNPDSNAIGIGLATFNDRSKLGCVGYGIVFGRHQEVYSCGKSKYGLFLVPMNFPEGHYIYIPDMKTQNLIIKYNKEYEEKMLHTIGD